MKSADWQCPLCGVYPPRRPEIRLADPERVIELHPVRLPRPVPERPAWLWLLILAAAIIGLLARCV